jgi:D-arabinose 1-dehydrogenase-like Zn-dependent alcohol dehydrogenase
MRAVVFDRYGDRPVVREVPEPTSSPRGVVVRVEATGLCRSDIHGWLGHDDGIVLPHVPGHELVGTIASVGSEVRRFAVGQRVTTPFVCSCGRCPECANGNGQVCRNQTQPGFTHWGSYAELVALHEADRNLIALPDCVDAGAAALLGCRFATAFRAVVQLGRVQRGETLLVVGCGGVGLSCVMVGAAQGARVVAVDVAAPALDRATRLGAGAVADISGLAEAAALEHVRTVIGGDGADVSVDALGLESALGLAIRSLVRRGRHVQVGLFATEPVVPMTTVIAKELTMLGAHGMAASDYPELVDQVGSGALRPQDVVDRWVTLDDVPEAMEAMRHNALPGVTMIAVGGGSRCRA